MDARSGTIYDSGEYLRKNPTWHQEDASWKAGQVLKMLRKHGLEPSTVCDIGCGAGGVIGELAKAYPQAVCMGYDVSPDAHALSQHKSSANLSFVLGTPLGAEHRFDLACALDVFEHVDDYLGFLRQMRSVAIWKLYHIPLDVSAQAVVRARPLRNIREKVGHLHFFTKDQALATLIYTDHIVVDWFYTAGAIEAPSRSIKARTLSLPRRLLFSSVPDFAVRLLGGYSLLALCR